MKKFISVALVAAMIASMGVTAFASTSEDYKDSVARLDTSYTSYKTDQGNFELYFPIYMKDTTLPITDTTNITGATEMTKTLAAGAKADYVYDGNIEDFDTIKLKVKMSSYKDYVTAAYIDTVSVEDIMKPADGEGYKGKVAVGDLRTIDPKAEVYCVVLELEKNNTTSDIRVKGNMELARKGGSTLGDDFDFNFKIALATAKSTDDANGGMTAMDVDTLDIDEADAVINLIDFNKGTIVTNPDYAAWEKTKEAWVADETTNGTAILAAYNKAEGTKLNAIDATVRAWVKVDANYITAKNMPKNDVETPKATALFNVANFKSNVSNIELEDNDGFHFTVKASDQGKVNLNYDNKAVKEVAKNAPANADLTFYNFYGRPTFDFTGTATITFPEDDTEYYLYAVAEDGTLSEVAAKTNDDGDGAEFKTRTLGCYVLSDAELSSVAADDKTDGTTDEEDIVTPDGVKPNPGTGVAAALVF